jgi:hypothetical protein
MVVGQRAQPSFRQVGGRNGDAVAGDAEAGAQSGELARGRAGRGQHVGGLQRGDDVTGPVADKHAQLGAGQLPGVVLRDGSRAGEDPGGDDVQQELTGAVCRPGHVTSGAGI